MFSRNCRFFLLLVCILFVDPDLLIEYSKAEYASGLCGLTTDQLIEHYGYKSEIHKISTEDEYVLTVFRCNTKTTALKKPVILHHGIVCSSDDFSINPPNQSLAYILADAGYDVWILNSRGNFYSREHLNLDPNNSSSGFWNFSWYEMGTYDLPACINYVLKQTNNRKLLYVGHSQGTTAFMCLLSEKPEYNDKIHVASLLAPVGYNKYVNIYKMLYDAAPVLQPTKGFEIFPRNSVYHLPINLLCAVSKRFCNAFVNSLNGPSENQRNNKLLSAFMCHFPSGSSIKQPYHYSQLQHFGYFGKYITGNETPSDFSLERIAAPLSLHYSNVDKFADIRDVEHLIPKLPNIIYLQRINATFDHIDFLWSKNAANLVYTKVLNIFAKY